MFDSDIIAGWVSTSNIATINDYYSDSESEPVLDTSLGGSSDVNLISGSISDTFTTLTFVRKLKTKDEKFDREIFATGANDMIYAWGKSSDKGLNYHGNNHNHVHIDFSKKNGIPDTAFGYEESGQLSRSLVNVSYYGALSTWQSEPAGSSTVYNVPFGSVADLADDGSGQPLLLLSLLERNIINIQLYPACSLHIFTTPESIAQINHPEYFDVMTKPRTTLLGHLVPVPEAELEHAREIYLEKHPTSKAWIGFSDFILYRFMVDDVYVVGGFGNEHYIGWISTEQYLSN